MLVELIAWIDQHTAGLDLPSDERSLISAGCFDLALEHQASIAILYDSDNFGSMLALLRVLAESVVRGMWLLNCANDEEIDKYKRGKIKTYGKLIEDYESFIGTPDGVLSRFKDVAWSAMNDFVHTGFIQVSRRHVPGFVEGNYPAHEIAKALQVAGVLGMLAGFQIVVMANRQDILTMFVERMAIYTKQEATF